MIRVSYLFITIATDLTVMKIYVGATQVKLIYEMLISVELSVTPYTIKWSIMMTVATKMPNLLL